MKLKKKNKKKKCLTWLKSFKNLKENPNSRMTYESDMFTKIKKKEKELIKNINIRFSCKISRKKNN